jgi:hypothetical protein
MNQLYIFYRLNKEINDRKDKFSMKIFFKDMVKETMIINPGVDMTIEEEILNVEECLIKLTNKNWIIQENDEFMVNKKNRGVKEILEKMENIERELKERLDIEWTEEEVMSGDGVLKEEKEYMKNMYDMIHQEFCLMKKEREKLDRQKRSYMEMEEEEESSDEENDEYEKVKSSDGRKEYMVNMSRWTCSCPGFMYSLYDPPQCKHVYQVYIKKNKGKTDTTEYEERLNKMVNKKR